MFGVVHLLSRFTVCRGYNYRVTHSICGSPFILLHGYRGLATVDRFFMLEAQTFSN
jgi:hypothetical protein